MSLEAHAWLLPLAFPDYYSVSEQDAARTRLQRVFPVTGVELERERRQRESHPSSSVTHGTDNEIED